MAAKKLLILPGDGIGVEVITQTRRVIDWLSRKRGITFDISEGLLGGSAYDATGTPFPAETLEKALQADAVLLGAVGGPKWDDLPFDKKPERGLLGIRKEMGLFANLRPAVVYEELADASSLKSELVAGLDIMIIRELTGGMYFGEPRGIETLPDGSRRGYNTLVYTTEEIRRIGRVAFEIARERGRKVCSVDKANVLEATVLWREEMIRLRNEEYPDIELSHMLVDNAAMQLVRYPKQFDVMVTENTFGDILSDCASMLTGSLGMLPSASLGAPDENGTRRALYEPSHGSAPDIAGKDIANPLATILSFTMLLRYSFGMSDEALMIETAIKSLLRGGLRTADIMQPNKAKVSTSVMVESLLRELDKLA